MLNVEKATAEKHYADLSSKPFFPALVDYICSGPVVAMVWEGKGVVATGRKMIGATNPLASEPGTIRGDFAVEVGRNVIHGSDSVENAQKEIALWFGGEHGAGWPQRGGGGARAAAVSLRVAKGGRQVASPPERAGVQAARCPSRCANLSTQSTRHKHKHTTADLVNWEPAAKPWIYEL